MNTNILAIILGMAAVTYIPRMLPALFMDRFEFPAWFQKWLRCIPYAALAALIFPGVLSVDSDEPLVGVIAGLFAAGMAFFNLHIVIIMVAAIAATILVQNVLF
jgi:branched-subunit amino acid transport protein